MPEREPEFPYIRCLTPEDEKRIKKIPFLNIDTLLIPSPYVKDKTLDIDYDYSYVWDEEGELLGYFLVYSDQSRSKFHIYKIVTSPFGRGKGIGSAFIEKLVNEIDGDADVYLYVWEKLISSIEFFIGNGFHYAGNIVYRKMKFNLMASGARSIRKKIAEDKDKDYAATEELGKVRHDAKKSLKVLLDMTSIMSADNFHKLVEDINRETTALLNTLNAFEDKIVETHQVDVKELIIDRVIPFIEASNTPCAIRLVLGSKIPPVIGNYMNYSRALINLVSNSLDAIGETDREGVIEIALRDEDDAVVLSIEDNGIGIEKERLQIGADRLPKFVGKTSKQKKTGEGIGTTQIFATFEPNNIQVDSRLSKWTRWTIRLPKSSRQATNLLAELESRYLHLMKSTEKVGISARSQRTQVAIFIWQLRQIEIFSYDLINQFSRYNNVRDIYRNILLYRYGQKEFAFLEKELNKCRVDNQIFKTWLLDIVARIKRNEDYILENVDFQDYMGVLFKSYGQAIARHIVFTLDPDDGRFFSCDRRLAEHMDFVPYLGRDRDELLRGEFIGDVKNLESPITLGVWTTVSREDLQQKLQMIRRGARLLLEMGLKKEKRLSFYHTTYNTADYEIDTFKTTTLGEMAAMSDEDLDRFIVEGEDEFSALAFVD
jgi:GNAT superfamily N-acetyltransferase/two-component sensor histidine kinase